MKYNLYQRLKCSFNGIFIFILIASITLFTNCKSNSNSDSEVPISEVELIPAPTKLLYKRGHFRLTKSSRILMNLSDDKSKKAGELLLTKIKSLTGYQLKIADRFTTSKLTSSIEIITDQTSGIKSEGFKIEIKSDRIRLYAIDNQGLVYGANAVTELFVKKNQSWQAPQLLIDDYPNTLFRGVYIPDSLVASINDVLVSLLIKNRINHLFVSDNEEVKNNKHITVHQLVSLKKSKVFNQNLSSIHEFYHSSINNMDTLIFVFNKAEQMHPDSIAIIGEAMWTTFSKRNYERLEKQLAERN